LITSARRAAAVCGVTRFAVRAWMDLGLLPEPPWTAQQLRQISDAAEPRPGPQAPHGTRARWSHGCDSCNASKRKTTLEGPTGERGRRTGYRWRCGSGSWTLSTQANPFRQVLRNLGPGRPVSQPVLRPGLTQKGLTSWSLKLAFAGAKPSCGRGSASSSLRLETIR
jgi:hypothetical protein